MSQGFARYAPNRIDGVSGRPRIKYFCQLLRGGHSQRAPAFYVRMGQGMLLASRSGGIVATSKRRYPRQFGADGIGRGERRASYHTWCAVNHRQIKQRGYAPFRDVVDSLSFTGRALHRLRSTKPGAAGAA